jgi:hypothetical protein
MLISEMHFTTFPNHTAYRMNPAGTARDDTAIIIKNCIKHHQLNSYSQDFLQATSVSVEDSVSLLTILAVYLPPRHSKSRTIRRFYNTLGQHVIAGGDYNAKHTDWDPDLFHSNDAHCSK